VANPLEMLRRAQELIAGGATSAIEGRTMPFTPEASGPTSTRRWEREAAADRAIAAWRKKQQARKDKEWEMTQGRYRMSQEAAKRAQQSHAAAQKAGTPEATVRRESRLAELRKAAGLAKSGTPRGAEAGKLAAEKAKAEADERKRLGLSPKDKGSVPVSQGEYARQEAVYRAKIGSADNPGTLAWTYKRAWADADKAEGRLRAFNDLRLEPEPTTSGTVSELVGQGYATREDGNLYLTEAGYRQRRLLRKRAAEARAKADKAREALDAVRGKLRGHRLGDTVPAPIDRLRQARADANAMLERYRNMTETQKEEIRKAVSTSKTVRRFTLLSKDAAKAILAEAKGDKDKARRIARRRGYVLEVPK